MHRFVVIALAAAIGLFVGCGGGTSKPATATSVQNVQTIAVNGGPVSTQTYRNGAFTSVTICVPATTTCQTIDGVLVDTGSYGLRLLQGQVSLPLPAVNASNGLAAQDCVSFPDGSFLWGPVVTADVQLAGETASSTSVHLISSATSGIPSTCSNGGKNKNTPQSLGAYGILGIGPEPVDCGSPCDPDGGQTSPPFPAYYSCSGSLCSPAFMSVTSQVTNPVVLFTTDNNGVILKLPSVSGTAGTISGSLIFGIGTESNNGLGSATVYTLDNNDQFTTNFSGQALSESFIDSGSNGVFFPDTSIPACSSTPVNFSAFYCPLSLLNLTATITGTNSKTADVNFGVDNAKNLFNGNPTDVAFENLGGPSASFIWGLPFFYGRTVYTAIDKQSMPSGAPPAPWLAF